MIDIDHTIRRSWGSKHHLRLHHQDLVPRNSGLKPTWGSLNGLKSQHICCLPPKDVRCWKKLKHTHVQNLKNIYNYIYIYTASRHIRPKHLLYTCFNFQFQYVPARMVSPHKTKASYSPLLQSQQRCLRKAKNEPCVPQLWHRDSKHPRQYRKLM